MSPLEGQQCEYLLVDRVGSDHEICSRSTQNVVLF